MEPVIYREMRAGEEHAVCKLVQHVFNELVGPDYEPEGVDEFFRFANAAKIAERVRAGGFVLVAEQSGQPVGVLEFGPPQRIRLLFVTRREQGIGKELVRRAIAKARRKNPALSAVTVHSSPYAEPAYRKMGFRRSGDARVEHGIRFVPMELVLEDRPEKRVADRTGSHV